jgi:hypothetical protein
VQRALEDAADGDAAKVIRIIEIGDQNLQRAVGVAGGRGMVETIASKSGCRSTPGVAGSRVAVPALATA